ncbi:hypothetical protein JVT61DRAFT_12406 [Boletus reticuloceps]|nr:hypothetical protein JVT61DRAFT_12406 [Boletus reticuloceps]
MNPSSHNFKTDEWILKYKAFLAQRPPLPKHIKRVKSDASASSSLTQQVNFIQFTIHTCLTFPSWFRKERPPSKNCLWNPVGCQVWCTPNPSLLWKRK